MRSSDLKWIETVRSEPIYLNGVPSINEFVKSYAHDPIKYGIASRAFGEPIGKMIQYIVLGLRVSWRDYCIAPVHSLWHSAIWAIAVNDTEWLANAIAVANNPNAKHGPHPKYYSEIHKLFFAVLCRSEFPIDTAIRIANKKSLPASEALVAKFLLSLLTHDSQLTMDSLEAHLMSNRKIRFIDPAYKLYNVMTHGLYELAYDQCPELVANWDADRGMPWDAELFAWRRAGRNAISAFDGFADDEFSFLKMGKAKQNMM